MSELSYAISLSQDFLASAQMSTLIDLVCTSVSTGSPAAGYHLINPFHIYGEETVSDNTVNDDTTVNENIVNDDDTTVNDNSVNDNNKIHESEWLTIEHFRLPAPAGTFADFRLFGAMEAKSTSLTTTRFKYCVFMMWCLYVSWFWFMHRVSSSHWLWPLEKRWCKTQNNQSGARQWHSKRLTNDNDNKMTMTIHLLNQQLTVTNMLTLQQRKLFTRRGGDASNNKRSDNCTCYSDGLMPAKLIKFPTYSN